MRLIDADALYKRLEAIRNEEVLLHGRRNNKDCCTLSTALYEIEHAHTIEPEQRWIPCSERLPEEDYWLGGSGRQFSDEVLVSVANYDDEDIWTYISQTIDGEWALELPSHCKIIAWMPLPPSYKGDET